MNILMEHCVTVHYFANKVYIDRKVRCVKLFQQQVRLIWEHCAAVYDMVLGFDLHMTPATCEVDVRLMVIILAV